MRNVGLKFGFAALGVIALVLSVSSPALATQTATFDLTGVNGEALDGVYTSPYSGTVNGGAVVNVICDDFGDNSYLPEDWIAYVTSLSSIDPSGDDTILKWKGAESDSNVPGISTYNLSQLNAYTVAAYLDLEIINSASDATVQEQLSYALWELFDPTVAAGEAEDNWGNPCNTGTNNTGTPCTTDAVQPWLNADGDTTTLDAATADLNAAILTVKGNASIMNGYNVTIYSYSTDQNPTGPTGCNSCSPPPQEFITVTAVPEASSLAMFAAYLLFGGGSLLFFGRRRMLRNGWRGLTGQ